MNEFGYEVDFLAVGDESRSGDAIAIRWGMDLDRSTRNQFVMVIDGGYSYSAQTVVNHIKTFYYNAPAMSKRETKIDVLISTHPHSDHFGGIPLIYESANVSVVAMHRPWAHVGLPKWFHDGRVTANGIKQKLKDGLEAAYNFSVDYKDQTKRDTIELYAGYTESLPYGVKIYVLGPSKDYYDRLLPDFNATPTNGLGVGEDRIVLYGHDVPAYMGYLTDAGDTSAENLSGIILALKMPNDEILIFTGDAGVDSLTQAMKQFLAFGLEVDKIRFFQVPHHGSCQNIGPTLLDFLFGKPGKPNQAESVTAYISVAAKPDVAHPSRRVINALLDRNCVVYKTQGTSLQHYRGSARLHLGWHVVDCLNHFDYVEG